MRDGSSRPSSEDAEPDVTSQREEETVRGDGPSARTPDGPAGAHRPDVVILMTDQERAAPPYESAELRRWRSEDLRCERWFAEHAYGSNATTRDRSHPCRAEPRC